MMHPFNNEEASLGVAFKFPPLFNLEGYSFCSTNSVHYVNKTLISNTAWVPLKMTRLKDLMNVKKLLKEIQEKCGQSYVAPIIKRWRKLKTKIMKSSLKIL